MNSGNKQERAVVSSALWAATGDALGWMSELTDERGLRYRTGEAKIYDPVAWRRRVGGRFGPTVSLPAGTYSDDTQLRLAVCRAIRGSGEFDVEAFAKVELPVWRAYALGGGRGTMAAANHLCKHSVSWFSNFFSIKGGRGYFDAGGNGAAMRIQPHVWHQDPKNSSAYIADVMRDAVVTHGHPKGFCGAVFHASCLAFALQTGEVPGPNEWEAALHLLSEIPEIVASDDQLRLFWLGAWEQEAKTSLLAAVTKEVEAAFASISKIESCIARSTDYSGVVEALGGFDERLRGAGMETAMLSAVLAWLHRNTSNEEALLMAANTLHSDTDSIGTMAGAVLGAVRLDDLSWPLQDRDYIEDQARRLARIHSGAQAESFSYPDLMKWEAPINQNDIIGKHDDSFAVAGLGPATEIGEEGYNSGETIWEWFRLEFGQTVLAKRRLKPKRIDPRELPSKRIRAEGNRGLTMFGKAFDSTQPGLPLDKPQRAASERTSNPSIASSSANINLENLDVLTDRVIRSDFDPTVLGGAFLTAATGPNPIEGAMGFGAIIAKALAARKRRNQK